jgi:hypothetical protein
VPHSFDQHGNDLNGLILADTEIVQWLWGNVSEGFVALFAAITLIPLVETEFEYFRLAVVTRHFWLDFLSAIA